MWVFMYNWVTRCGPAQLIFINTDQSYAQWDMNTAVIPAGGSGASKHTVHSVFGRASLRVLSVGL